MNVSTEADFERLSWHDCHVRGISFEVGNPEENDWTSDLVLQLDFIVEWQRPKPDAFAFLVAPARLAFHGVTDPRIGINWGESGFQNALHPVSIDTIERHQIENQKVHLNRPYFAWRIELNWPSGEIAFGAVGFTQSFLAEPALVDTQHLPNSAWRRLTIR